MVPPKAMDEADDDDVSTVEISDDKNDGIGTRGCGHAIKGVKSVFMAAEGR
jgi:hypothetical protein